MYYSNIKYYDVANGPGVRTSLFVSGCTHHCRNCFNREAWPFEAGQPYTNETEDKIIESLSPEYIDGLSLLGGEPFEPENQETVLDLVRHVKRVYPDKTIWAWSGYTFEQLTGKESARCFTPTVIDLLNEIDVLVDGEYVDSLYDITLRFRGSRNQRILDVRASLQKNTPVFWHDDPFYETHKML